jgi:hypothetical protein
MTSNPVHDAIIEARLHDLRHGHTDVSRSPSRVSRRSLTAPIRALRVRVGRAIVALGSMIEGPCECPDGAAGVGAA